jgi:sugar phosphate isomerase/epimerase
MASYLGLGPTLYEKFQTIKALGFDSVELLPVDLDNDVEDIKKWLAETGLKAVSVHAEPTEEIVKKIAAIGGQAVIWAGTPFCSKAEAREVAHLLDGMADMAKPYGIKVAYHNHSQEFYFDEGKSLLEHLLDNSTKCYSQLDCGWAMNGGMYPPYFIRKYRNRIISIHVKENSKVTGPGGVPASRHAPPDAMGGMAGAFANVKSMPLEERRKMLENIENMIAQMSAEGGPNSMDVQCKMGATESNINWKEIKKALDEQDFEAFWIVERESFYDDHDKCIAEDCEWIKVNII